MKKIASRLFLKCFMFIGIVFLFVSCKEITEEELDECKQTEWSEAKHFDVMPRVRVLGGEVDGRDLKDAIMVTYKGHISKFYCKDNKSTQFNYSPGEFYPEFIEEEYWTGGFLIGKTFGFLLKNDEDYVKYYLEFEAIFDEFTSYKMITVGKVKYPDIFMSIDDMKQFFYVDITNDLIWQ